MSSSRVYTGTVSGETASRYPSHAYRTVVIHPLTMWDVDPDRGYSRSGYPRYTSKVQDWNGDTTAHVNYAVTIDDNPNTFRSTITVMIYAGKYTSAKYSSVALQFEVDSHFADDRTLVDEALRRTFT